MDRIEKYRQVLESIVKRHAQFQPANGDIKTCAVCDSENNEYMVIDSGWNEKGRRIYDVVLHFRLQDGVVCIEAITRTPKSFANYSNPASTKMT